MNELYETLLTVVRETIESGDVGQAANHCGILLEHLMQEGASDATLLRAIGRLDEVRRDRARRDRARARREAWIDRLLADGYRPSGFKHDGFHDGMQLAKDGQVFTFTTTAEVAYIKGKQC
jgi:hypothetical protein